MTKAVIIDADSRICARVIGPTGAEHRHLANRVMEEALGGANLSFGEIAYVVATGYGRLNVPFADRQITELTCHARGVVSLFPTVRIAIDIGGQDAKGLQINDGKLVDFVMNDRCALTRRSESPRPSSHTTTVMLPLTTFEPNVGTTSENYP